MEKDLIYGQRLSDETYTDFQVLWSQKRFDHQRYGQAFCNYFGITNSELFYSNDGTKIQKMIHEYLENYQIYS